MEIEKTYSPKELKTKYPSICGFLDYKNGEWSLHGKKVRLNFSESGELYQAVFDKNSKITRKQTNKKTNKIKKAQALERDNYKCVKCGSDKDLHVHHIVQRAHGGTDNLDNLLTLCKQCHANAHCGDRVYRLMVAGECIKVQNGD